jgi:hypothetical protein
VRAQGVQLVLPDDLALATDRLAHRHRPSDDRE